MLDGVYAIDMTEVEGVDDLHDPTDVILDEQKRLARLYGADESFMLVGGSTVGNLAAVYSACNEGDSIVIQRNSHKSVYNAVMLRHLRVDYILPDIYENGIYKAITLEQVKDVVKKNLSVKAMVLTSPTYEGFHIQMEEIADFLHKNEIILIVDQAHGAHLGFNPAFTNSAVGFADITIQSIHKTLPSLTQTAAMHISGNRVNRQKIREALDIFETSSPSYVLMNSMSQCMDILEESCELFNGYVDNLKDFYRSCGELKHLKLIQCDYEQRDPGKIILSTEYTKLSGIELAKILRDEYEIETELSSFAYVLAMTSFMDSKEGFERLKKALFEIDDKLQSGQIVVPDITVSFPKKMEIFEAKAGEEILIDLNESIGRISATMVCIYPPGAPIIVPGEEITEDTVTLIKQSLEKNLHITGLRDNCISVVN